MTSSGEAPRGAVAVRARRYAAEVRVRSRLRKKPAAAPHGPETRRAKHRLWSSVATYLGGVIGVSSRQDSETPVILHLTAMRSTKHGGLERYFVEVARRCSARGFRSVIQYNVPPLSTSYLEDLRAAGGAVVVQALDAGRVSSAFGAMRLIVRCRPVLVHLHFCHSWTRLVVGLFAVRFGVTRSVVTVHLMPGEQHRVLLRASYSRFDRILAVSHAVERALLGIGVPRTGLTTHYLGVPELGPLPQDAGHEIRVRFGIPATSRVLVTMAFNSRMKAVDVLVAAFVDHLAAEWPDLHLLIVGMERPAGMVGGRSAHSCLDRLHWAGVHDDVRPFLAAADIYVQSSRAEAFGLGIVEAMRQSLPVVATKVGGVPEVVVDGKTGVLVAPDWPTELAAAVVGILRDPDLARRLGRAGHERWKSRFGLTRSVDELVTKHYGLPAC